MSTIIYTIYLLQYSLDSILCYIIQYIIYIIVHYYNTTYYVYITDHPYEADGLRSLHWEPISSLQGLLVSLPAVQVPSPHPQMHCLTPSLPAGLESWGLIYFTA